MFLGPSMNPGLAGPGERQSQEEQPMKTSLKVMTPGEPVTSGNLLKPAEHGDAKDNSAGKNLNAQE